MKKIFSIILSAIMAFSAISATALSATANVISPGGETTVIEIGTTVNGSVSTEITFSKDAENPYEITFTYTGTGVLEGWSFIPDNVTIILQEGNSITILVDPSVDKVIANAIVKGSTPEVVVPQPGTDSTSPSTGAVALSSTAITGAGVAVLAILKKKNDAE